MDHADESRIWTCSRFGYQKVFRQAAEERGITVEFSAPIETVDIENTIVVLRDGRRMQADLIVGADGKYVCQCIEFHLMIYRDRLDDSTTHSR